MHGALFHSLVALTNYSVTKKYKNDQNLISISGDKVVKRLPQGKKSRTEKIAKNEMQCCEHFIYTRKHQGMQPKASKCSWGVILIRLSTLPAFCCRNKRGRGCPLPLRVGSSLGVLLLSPLAVLAVLRQSELLKNA